MENLRKQKKNLNLARFEGETISTEQSRIRKEETKSKEKEPGTLLQRPISVC